jgi:predicted nucleic acid-binding protein
MVDPPEGESLSNPPIIIDTNVLSDTHFLHWLRMYRAEKIIPPIVYAEYAYHFLVKGRDLSALDRALNAAQIRVGEMDKHHSAHGANFAFICRQPYCGDPSRDIQWLRTWRDSLIASFAAIPPFRMITNNIDDFNFLGERAMTPYEFKEGIENGTIR